MSKDHNSHHEGKQSKIKSFGRWLRPYTWPLIVIGGVAVIVWRAFVLLQFKSQFLTSNTDPSQYVTGNLLNVMIILAVVIQALIYLKMAGQNERLITASEGSADVAREAFRAGERAYFGVQSIEPEDLGPDADRFPKIKIDFWNGGKTPAWHIHTFVDIGLGRQPDTCEKWPMTLDSPSMRNTFVIAQGTQGFKYVQTGFKYTAQRMHQVENDEFQLFVIVKIHYRDFRKVWHSQVFRAVWCAHGPSPQFFDFDASERDCKVCKKDRGEGN